MENSELWCEFCGVKPGIGNSAHLFNDGEDVGIWICAQCEQDAAQIIEEDRRELARAYGYSDGAE